MIIEEELDHLLLFAKLSNQLKLNVRLNPNYGLILISLLETPLHLLQYLLTHLFLLELTFILNYFLRLFYVHTRFHILVIGFLKPGRPIST